jgi:OmpA-OmpF porin, OOP family
MHFSRALLALVGSVVIAAPVMASDKLPKRPQQDAKPAASAPAEASDPSTEPIPDTPPPPSAAAPSAAPPPASGPAPQAAAPGGTGLPDYPFVLFFEWDSAQLSAGAAEVLDNVADKFHRMGGRVTISGFADRSGAGDYNRGLSQRRVEVVKAYLASKDIAASAISTEAYGEGKPVVDTADGLREPQNRRVEITVSPADVSVR